jgi:hypothetical protein
MEFEKQLIKKFDGQINSHLQQLNTTKEYLQKFVDKATAIGIKVDENDLQPLFANPKAYITDKLLTGESVEFGGLKLSKEKLFDLIELPTGTTGLIESILEAQRNQQTREYHVFKIGYFSVVENTVTVNAAHLEFITNSNSLFIENENQKQGFEKTCEIVKLINEINLLDGQKIDLHTDFEELMQRFENGFEVKATAVKRFR